MEFDDITQTVTESPAVALKREKLPWVLFAVTALVFAVSAALLVRRAGSESARANREYVERTQAESRVVELETQVKAEQLEAAKWEGTAKTAAAEKDSTAAELATTTKKLAQAEAALARANAKAEARKKAEAKKKAAAKKKSTRRRRR